MYVIKQDGRQEPVRFDKITARLKKVSYGLRTEHCDLVLVAQKVCAGVYKGVTTTHLDELAAETANHPDYAVLAARIAVSNLHKNTNKSFSETIKIMHHHVDKRSEKKAFLIANDVYEIIMKNATRLDSEIIYERDFDYDYFGFKTLERSYILKIDGVIVERPEHMLMRAAVGIHKDDIESAVKIYHLMAQRCFTHATSLFNAGTPPSPSTLMLSSCFLVCMNDDSIEGIYDTLKECAIISKLAGGIGLSIHNICATGSYMCGTNGTSNGIIPMLHVFNDTSRYVDQGRGKRKDCWGEGFENLCSDYETEVTATIAANLNKNIDINYNLVETARRSNLRHRLIGIGIQGLADTFILLGMPFDSPEAQQLNKDIFETIYYHALKASSELAAKDDPYETYGGSPVSKGILQMDMWGVMPSDRWNWNNFREMISKNGVRNSLLVAPMPTDSTSQILGNNECFEPYTSNIYSRRVLSGEFVVVNKHLLHDLTENGLWSQALKNKIISENGSVAKIPEIPEQLKAIYKILWEIKQKTLVDMAAD